MGECERDAGFKKANTSFGGKRGCSRRLEGVAVVGIVVVVGIEALVKALVGLLEGSHGPPLVCEGGVTTEAGFPRNGASSSGFS